MQYTVEYCVDSATQKNRVMVIQCGDCTESNFIVYLKVIK